MQSNLSNKWALPPTWLRFLLIILLVLGIFFRFVNLDKKVYWRDEALTSLQISGYTQTEVIQETYTGQVLGLQDLQKYQRIKPNTSVIDTVKSLAVETPEHPPLYYIMSRLWVQLFGDSVVATRSLSALLSLLVFPATYWLCLELFDSPLIGWIAVALMAVSPFHVLYAQEAREYSFWTGTILLSSAALLRAMRRQTKLSWGMYAFNLALGFYSYLFFAFVAVSHGIYAIVIERFRLTKTLVAYLIAATVGLLAFAPWLIIVITNISQLRKSMAWINFRFTIPELVTRWVFNLNRIFVDWNYGFSFNSPFPYLIIISILVLVGYSLYFLWRQTSPKQWLFVFTLIGVTALALGLPDLISGGQRSRVLRYLIPCYLGIQLAVAYLLATKMTYLSAKSWQQQLWRFITIALLSAGVLSCALSAEAEIWWNKAGTNLEITHIINKATHPLVISDTPLPSDMLYLSHILDQKVKFQLVEQPHFPEIPAGFSDVFLYNPSKTLRSEIEKQQNHKVKRLKEQLFEVEK